MRLREEPSVDGEVCLRKDRNAARQRLVSRGREGGYVRFGGGGRLGGEFKFDDRPPSLVSVVGFLLLFRNPFERLAVISFFTRDAVPVSLSNPLESPRCGRFGETWSLCGIALLFPPRIRRAKLCKPS